MGWNIGFDILRKVCVNFFRVHTPQDALIEWVDPGGPQSPVSSLLERGGGLHHLCYQVKDLDSHLGFRRAVGSIIIRPPVPAPWLLGDVELPEV